MALLVTGVLSVAIGGRPGLLVASVTALVAGFGQFRYAQGLKDTANG